ncbi:48c010b0-de8a-43df-aca0-5dd7c0698a46 [Sclerotinia trifoliorum]|uniref:48c010b0-de8a-43df-aca0-5dd7c0698a46 n=1 Tax=Sclerotinia trifoliorum TaxID=28548 RepID=A0A8H2VNV3_9HELO|nr:48c010b0-de8a-43df-aca0-5dd7c0698a46 [Sclerotinia trifoliorum]
MHYIRIFKQPRLLPVSSSTSSSSPRVLSAKITITTDLGESFLMSDVKLRADIEVDGVSVGTGKEYIWKGTNGMRSLEVQIPVRVPREGVRWTAMIVRPVGVIYEVDSFEDVLHFSDRTVGGIAKVRSRAIDLKTGATMSDGMAERVFSTGFGMEEEIRIWEETGESIARHIWDAGLVLSSYLSSLRNSSKPVGSLPTLEKFLSTQQDINILELGAGCGIVGITLAKLFYDRISKILLTDLPEASEILEKNISTMTPKSDSSLRCSCSHQVLDWSMPLPEDVRGETWELVVVADCTYNPDVVPDLVQTLTRVRDGNSGMLILLAMKVRHDSEMVFFELMEKEEFVVVERCKVPLKMVGEEGQEIEIFVFR